MKPSLPRRTLTGSKLPQWVTSWPRGPLKRRFLRKDSAMRILALDLAKNKSVYLDYVTGGERTFGKVATNAPEMEKLLSRCRPDWVVIEACPAAGWVCDLVQRMNIPIQVANANDERQGLGLPSRTNAWTQQALAELDKEVAGASSQQVWLFQVGCELEQFRQV